MSTSRWARGVYDALPIPIQNLTFSAVGAHLNRQRQGGVFRRTLSWLKRTDFWNAEQIETYQQHALDRLLQKSVRLSPFYISRGLSDLCSGDPSDAFDRLSQFPVLRKADFADASQRLIPSPGVAGRLITGLTSGTTGSPLKVYHTAESLQAQWAIWWRFRGRFGVHPGERYLTVGARVPVPASQRRPPYWRWDLVSNRCYLSSYHLGPDQIDAAVEMITRTRFQFVTGYPSAIAQLAARMIEVGEFPIQPPKAVLTGSDALSAPYRALIAEAFKAPVFDQYGMAEFAGNISQCPAGNYHDDFEAGIVEMIPASTNGQTRYRILLTGLLNTAMPLVRYDIGDEVSPLGSRCTCGRSSRAYSSLNGRAEAFVHTPDGRRVTGLNQVLEYFTGVRESQIHQVSADRIIVRYVPTGSAEAVDTERVLQELHSRGLDQGIEISLQAVPNIPRESNGKFLAVKSDVVLKVQ